MCIPQGEGGWVPFSFLRGRQVLPVPSGQHTWREDNSLQGNRDAVKGLKVGQPKATNDNFLPIILCFKIHD